MNDRLLTTAEAAKYLGWPSSRLHNVLHEIPEFAEGKRGGKAGPGKQNLWRKSRLELVALLVKTFDMGYVPAARMSCVSRIEGDRIVIDLPRPVSKAPVDMSIVHMA